MITFTAEILAQGEVEPDVLPCQHGLLLLLSKKDDNRLAAEALDGAVCVTIDGDLSMADTSDLIDQYELGVDTRRSLGEPVRCWEVRAAFTRGPNRNTVSIDHSNLRQAVLAAVREIHRLTSEGWSRVRPET